MSSLNDTDRQSLSAGLNFLVPVIEDVVVWAVDASTFLRKINEKMTLFYCAENEAQPWPHKQPSGLLAYNNEGD